MASFFSKLFGGGGTEEGAEKGIAERNRALATGTKYAEDKTAQGAGYYDKAQQWFDPSYETANLGNTAYAEAMGLTTPEARQKQFELFRTSPGVQGALDEGANQRARLAALTGNLASSNTSQAINDATGTKLSQGWGEYLQRLLPYVNQAPAIAGQRAGVDVGQGNLWSTLGNTILGANLNTGNANAGSYLEAGKAQDAGAGRLMDTVLGIGKLAGNILAPGSGALMDSLGGGLAGYLTGGQGYGTGGSRAGRY